MKGIPMDGKRLEKALSDAALALSSNEERFMEIESMISAQRFLLEQAYANAFLENPDGFSRFMADAIEKTRSMPVVPEQMPDEARTERIVRIATHLSRFGESVQRRLRDGARSP